MPHSTTNSSSPIPIPNNNGYGRHSSSASFNTPTMTARSTTLNDDSDYAYNNVQEVNNVNMEFDQTYPPVFSNVPMYPSAISSVPVGRNSQQNYPRDYNCCGVDHQNLHDLFQHVDTYHRGMIVHDLYGENGIIQIPYETNTFYSQYNRWNSIPIPASSVQPHLMTSVPSGTAHEQKNQNGTQSNINTVAYSVPSSYKQKGSNNGLEYNQSDLGQFNGFDQIDPTGQSQSDQDNLMLLYWCDQNTTNPLRDPNFSSTLFEGHTPSSISTSLDDDPLREFPSKKTLQSPSFSETGEYISSPISSDDNTDHSTVVSPVKTAISISTLGQISATTDVNLQNHTSPKTLHNKSNSGKDDSGVNLSQQRPSNNVQQGPQRSNLNNISNKQPSYGSINNNSRPRPIAVSPGSVTRSSSYAMNNISNSESLSGSPNKLPSFQRCSPSSNNNYSSFLQPRRSSTSNIIAQNGQQQYGSVQIPNLGQVNIPTSSNNNVSHPRRSSTSNLTVTRPIATTTPQSYNSHISIGSSLPYMSTSAQFTGNTVDYPLVGYMSSGETGSGASTQFAKYQRIQPKAGGVAMSDVYADPALGGIKGSTKKRTSSTESKPIKQRRVTKPDESAEASVPSELADVQNRGGEADIYPYKCSVLGCPKAYKNANGLKYHNEHGHAQSGNGAREKPWACRIGGCLKTYGSKGGLIYHVKHCHPNDLWALP